MPDRARLSERKDPGGELPGAAHALNHRLVWRSDPPLPWAVRLRRSLWCSQPGRSGASRENPRQGSNGAGYATVVTGIALVDLQPIHGCPDRVLGVQVMEESHPYSYAQMAILPNAVARAQSARGMNNMARPYCHSLPDVIVCRTHSVPRSGRCAPDTDENGPMLGGGRRADAGQICIEKQEESARGRKHTWTRGERNP
jgi:hypothetical protein